ncbi:Gag-pol fusion protein [Phytophthora palmivora]|uniref:Gag-pol fusion protein n=1 Tax=Phytophthora palmivora TaxID=4796 RepID=A0A2P4XDB6_9STRA|nr:Gag-pol fusion protein [Phytophthora palmivora]
MPQLILDLIQCHEAKKMQLIFDSEWASPAFFLKKPDGRLRLLMDFRWLNTFMKRILIRLGEAKCFSSSDANMGYYARQLAKQCRKYTAFLYSIWELSVQEVTDGDFNCTRRVSSAAEDHIEHLRVVLTRLQEFNVTIFFKTAEYLGFMLSSDGIQPQLKKVRAIMDLIAPKTKKQLRQFLGMINYYREMIPSKSAMLKSLTRMASPKATFMWTSVKNEVFEGVKKALANVVLLAFPDFTKPFDI